MSLLMAESLSKTYTTGEVTIDALKGLNFKIEPASFVSFVGPSGSANSCLAGYLLKHRYYKKDDINIRVEQGHEIGRPSLLYLRAEIKDSQININVGGRVIKVAEGVFV